MRNKFILGRRKQAASLQVRPNRIYGLTLVELLVAISVLAFVAVLGWRGLDSIVRARITLTSDLEQTRGMQITFAQLQSDCAHMASPFVFPNQIPLIVEPGRIALVRTVFTDNQPSRLQIVTYEVKDGKLTRRESAAMRDLSALEALWSGAVNADNTGEPVVLQSDVAAMNMRVWTSGGLSWGNGASVLPPVGLAANPLVPTGQITSTRTGLIPGFPAGLEVTLQLRGYDTGMLKIFLLGPV